MKKEIMFDKLFSAVCCCCPVTASVQMENSIDMPFTISYRKLRKKKTTRHEINDDCMKKINKYVFFSESNVCAC